MSNAIRDTLRSLDIASLATAPAPLAPFKEPDWWSSAAATLHFLS